MTNEQKNLIVGTIGAWASLAGVFLFLPPLFGFTLTKRLFFVIVSLAAIALVTFFLAGSNTEIYRRLLQLIRRAIFDLSGSSKRAFASDLLRFAGLAGFGIIAVRTYRWSLFSLDYRGLFMVSLCCLYAHSVMYPFAKKHIRWDQEYKLRKLMLLAAIDGATDCVQSTLTNIKLRHMEANALRAIKSYLEFKVLDTNGNSFTVNLLVIHPHADEKLVCIERSSTSNPERPVPRIYEDYEMKRPKKSLETGEVFYDGDFKREHKPYRMIWHVPIPSPHSKTTKYIGLLCVDSSRPHHLDLADERRSLVLNIAPYVAVLGYSLALRYRFHKWEPLPS